MRQDQAQIRRVYSTVCKSCQSSKHLHLRPFPIMHFSVTTCYIASLVATLVAITASLPQSPSGPPDGISRREALKRYPDIDIPQLENPPRACDRVGSTTYHIDIENVDKRDSLSPETNAVTLDLRSRRLFRSPYSDIVSDRQSDTFQIVADSVPLRPLI